MADEGTTFFEGTGGSKECTKFLQSVRAHAFAAGQSRDDDWIADYAATRMTDSAVLWFESLEEETQSSWKLLRRALLDEFAAPPISSRTDSPTSAATVSTPSSIPSRSLGGTSSTVSTAAAVSPGPSRAPELPAPTSRAPPETTATSSRSPERTRKPSTSLPAVTSRNRGALTKLTGRLKLLGTSSRADIYISGQVGLDLANPSLLQTTTSRNRALQVSYEPSSAGSLNGPRGKYVNMAKANYRLGMVWKKKAVDLQPGSTSYAGLVAVRTGIKTRTDEDKLYPSANWPGGLHTGTWRITSDGEVIAEMGSGDGTMQVLDTVFIPVLSGSSEYEVQFYVDPHCRRHPGGSRGRLMFESF